MGGLEYFLKGGLGAKKFENHVIFRKYAVFECSFLILSPTKLRDKERVTEPYTGA